MWGLCGSKQGCSCLDSIGITIELVSLVSGLRNPHAGQCDFALISVKQEAAGATVAFLIPRDVTGCTFAFEGLLARVGGGGETACS